MVDPVSLSTLRPVESRLVRNAQTGGSPSMPAAEAQAAPVPLSKLTAAARALADAGPPVDYARIAQIRTAISQGDYKIDSKAIADAMLRHYSGGPEKP
jgi:flagellar biosynthesis anti-sigma factor FlgM